MTEKDENADLPPVELTVTDLYEISRVAAGKYMNFQVNGTINGEKLTPDLIRTILWLEGVTNVLSSKGLLPRKVKVVFDK